MIKSYDDDGDRRDVLVHHTVLTLITQQKTDGQCGSSSAISDKIIIINDKFFVHPYSETDLA